MHTKQPFSFGQPTVTLDTGEFARQATDAVVLDIDGNGRSRDGRLGERAARRSWFFSAPVQHIEKSYAAGHTPEFGRVYRGVVLELLDFGATMRILQGWV